MKLVNAMPAALTASRPSRAQPFADVVAENLDAVYRYLVYLTGDRVEILRDDIRKGLRTAWAGSGQSRRHRVHELHTAQTRRSVTWQP